MSATLVALKPSGLPTTGILSDNAGTPIGSVDWFSRKLLKSDGAVVLDWGLQTLLDANEDDIADWSSGFKLVQAGAASKAALTLNGAILTGGTGTTNFPHLFIQPSGATAATNWSTSGTLIGANAATGFVGNLLDFKVAGSTSFKVNYIGAVSVGALGSFGDWEGSYFNLNPYHGLCIAGAAGVGGGIMGVKFTSGGNPNTGFDTMIYRAAAGCLEVNSGTANDLRDWKMRSAILRPPSSVTPSANGDLMFEATSNTSVTLKLKGSDGTVRSVALTLA